MEVLLNVLAILLMPVGITLAVFVAFALIVAWFAMCGLAIYYVLRVLEIVERSWGGTFFLGACSYVPPESRWINGYDAQLAEELRLRPRANQDVGKLSLVKLPPKAKMDEKKVKLGSVVPGDLFKLNNRIYACLWYQQLSDENYPLSDGGTERLERFEQGNFNLKTQEIQRFIFTSKTSSFYVVEIIK